MGHHNVSPTLSQLSEPSLIGCIDEPWQSQSALQYGLKLIRKDWTFVLPSFASATQNQKCNAVLLATAKLLGPLYSTGTVLLSLGVVHKLYYPSKEREKRTLSSCTL